MKKKDIIYYAYLFKGYEPQKKKWKIYCKYRKKYKGIGKGTAYFLNNYFVTYPNFYGDNKRYIIKAMGWKRIEE